MALHVLITGGAGFIGSHFADELLAAGYKVRVLDNLSEQVHGPDRHRPGYLSPEVELQVGDVRDPDDVDRALQGIDAVCHLAASVGVGQSMYKVRDYVAVNDLGTATLLQALTARPVRRLIVASSMSIYGEGLYQDLDGRRVDEQERDLQKLKNGVWDLCDREGNPLQPLPTPENKRPNLASVYALNKYVQERLCLLIGQAYGISTVALRFFNVYGPNQALSNPYTGVLAIFASRLLNDKRPMIFEDGLQRRDFVHVRDVARACRLALETPNVSGRSFNIGSGKSYTVRQVGEKMAQLMGKPALMPEITGRFRMGDIRHCFADIMFAREVMGFRPRIALEEGLAELIAWLSGQIAVDRFEEASRELAFHGLTA